MRSRATLLYYYWKHSCCLRDSTSIFPRLTRFRYKADVSHLDASAFIFISRLSFFASFLLFIISVFTVRCFVSFTLSALLYYSFSDGVCTGIINRFIFLLLSRLSVLVFFSFAFSLPLSVLRFSRDLRGRWLRYWRESVSSRSEMIELEVER